MNLDSGYLEVWRGENTAPPGGMPKLEYSRVWAGYYGEKTVGVNRWYTAKQAGDHPDTLVEVQRVYTLSAATDKVLLYPYSHVDEGGPYQITQIQQVTNSDGLPMTDLTLERDDGIDAGTITGSPGGAD